MHPYIVLALIPAIAAFSTGSAAIFTWQRQGIPGAKAFSFFSGSIFIWCFFAVFEYLSTDETARIIFGKIEYLGITTFSVFWLIFTLRYTHQDGWLTKRNVRWLMVLPSLGLLFAVLDPWLGLIWKSVTLVFSHGVPSLVIEHGWWFNYVLIPHNYLLTAIGIALLLQSFFSSTDLYRKQTFLLLTVALFAFACNVLYVVLDFTLYGLDLTPIGFAVSSVFLQFGIFRPKLLGLSPISYRTVFLNTAEAVIILDTRGNIIDLNPSALAESHLSKTLGEPFVEAFPGYQDPLGSVPVQDTTQIIELSQGQQASFKEIKIRPMLSPGGQWVGSLVLLRDVTLEQRHQAQLEQFAYFDSLTGLFNRRQLEIRAEQALSHQGQAFSPLAVLYIDLDKFKPINDTYGHAVGDAVLIQVAKRLQNNIRQGDLVARLGGDEFAALLFRADRITALRTCQRLLADLFQTIQVNGCDFHIRASIGIACYPEDGKDLEALLNHADQAMYREKQAH